MNKRVLCILAAISCLFSLAGCAQISGSDTDSGTTGGSNRINVSLEPDFDLKNYMSTLETVPIGHIDESALYDTLSWAEDTTINVNDVSTFCEIRQLGDSYYILNKLDDTVYYGDDNAAYSWMYCKLSGYTTMPTLEELNIQVPDSAKSTEESKTHYEYTGTITNIRPIYEHFRHQVYECTVELDVPDDRPIDVQHPIGITPLEDCSSSCNFITNTVKFSYFDYSEYSLGSEITLVGTISDHVWDSSSATQLDDGTLCCRLSDAWLVYSPHDIASLYFDDRMGGYFSSYLYSYKNWAYVPDSWVAPLGEDLNISLSYRTESYLTGDIQYLEPKSWEIKSGRISFAFSDDSYSPVFLLYRMTDGAIHLADYSFDGAKLDFSRDVHAVGTIIGVYGYKNT